MSDFHEEATTCAVEEQRQVPALIVLVVGTFLAPLDSSIVNIALPSIAAEFNRSLSSVSWVTSAYLLTIAALLLSMGRLGDLFGLRRLYVGGLLVFGLGSLGCAFAWSLPALVGARVVQAVGGAMMFAAGPALVTKVFPPNRRGWALGYIALAVSAGLTAGPALGGLLLGTFGWQSIFLINVPLSVVVSVIAWRMLADDCPKEGAFDFLGAALAAATLVLLLAGLDRAEKFGVFASQVLVPVAGAVALGVLFVWWERRHPTPMVDMRIFRSRSFSVGVGAATLAYLSLFSVTFTMPFYLLRVEGVDPRVAGLMLTATPLTMAVFAPIAGRASDRRGSRGLATGGLVVLALGLFVASLLAPGSPLWAAPAALLVVGTGMAVFQTPNTVAIMRATPPEFVGVGSAFIAQARNVGMAVGVALTAAIVGAAVGGQGLPNGDGPISAELAAVFSAGMSAALRTGAAIALVAAVMAWFGRGADPVEATQPKP